MLAQNPRRERALRGLAAAALLLGPVPEIRAAAPPDPIFASGFEEPRGCLSPDEALLATLVNQYRAANLKAAVPVSTALTLVAQWKVKDMASPTNPAGTGSCNLHSWSNDRPDVYTGCCYTPDHAQALCMWSKPSQITDVFGPVHYTATGYEIVVFGATTVAGALAAWQGSAPHNDVLLNNGIWASRNPWPAMGIGVDLVNRYYSIWFGDAADPSGPPAACAAP